MLRRWLVLGLAFCGLSFFGAEESHACCGTGTNEAVNALKNNVSSALNSYDREVIEQLEKNAKDQIKTTEALRKSLIEAIKQATQQIVDADQEIMRRAQTYETNRDLDKTFGVTPQTQKVICDDANRAQAVAQGTQAAQKTSGGRAANGKKWIAGSGDPNASVKAVVTGANLQDPQLDFTRFFDAATEAKDRQEMINRLVEFTPPNPISDKDAQTPQGKALKALDNERKLRNSVLLDAMKEVDFQTSPEIDFEGKKMSIADIIDETDKKMGFSSTDYRASLNTMQEADLLRQWVVQQAFGNFIERQIYALDMKRGMVVANQVSLEQSKDMKARIDAGRAALRVQ